MFLFLQSMTYSAEPWKRRTHDETRPGRGRPRARPIRRRGRPPTTPSGSTGRSTSPSPVARRRFRPRRNSAPGHRPRYPGGSVSEDVPSPAVNDLQRQTVEVKQGSGTRPTPGEADPAARPTARDAERIHRTVPLTLPRNAAPVPPPEELRPRIAVVPHQRTGAPGAREKPPLRDPGLPRVAVPAPDPPGRRRGRRVGRFPPAAGESGPGEGVPSRRPPPAPLRPTPAPLRPTPAPADRRVRPRPPRRPLRPPPSAP